MDRAQKNRYSPAELLHPGVVVAEYLEYYGWSQRDLARRTGLTPKTISEICNGKAPISAVTALALEKVFQRPAHLWLNLQRRYDEAAARQEFVLRAPEWQAWAQRFPLTEMRERCFSIPRGQSDLDALLCFFGVSSPDSWETVWKAAHVAYRQTRQFTISEAAVAAWVRQTELEASALQLNEFDDRKLVAMLDSLRKLTRVRIDIALNEAQKICSKAGVALVVVPMLKKTGISGCARWMSDKKAIVGLTLRYKTDDQIWFTLFHELGHILLHRRKRSFVIDNAVEDLSDQVVDPEMQQVEAEANTFSSNTLIAPAALGQFIRRRQFTSNAIHDFAEAVGVGPGIVVGRLQHEGILAQHQGNRLKQRVEVQFEAEGNST